MWQHSGIALFFVGANIESGRKEQKLTSTKKCDGTEEPRLYSEQREEI